MAGESSLFGFRILVGSPSFAWFAPGPWPVSHPWNVIKFPGLHVDVRLEIRRLVRMAPGADIVAYVTVVVRTAGSAIGRIRPKD